MLFLHHYKSVDVRVQIKEMFLFFPILRRKFLFFPIFSYFSAFSFLFSYFLQVIWHLTPCDMTFCDPEIRIIDLSSRTFHVLVTTRVDWNSNDCFKNRNDCFKWQRPFTKGKIATPSSKDLDLAFLDTENQDNGGQDTLNEEEDIVLVDDDEDW